MSSETDSLREVAHKVSSNFEKEREGSMGDIERVVRDIILIEKKYTHREGSSVTRENEVDKKVRNYIESLS